MSSLIAKGEAQDHPASLVSTSKSESSNIPNVLEFLHKLREEAQSSSINDREHSLQKGLERLSTQSRSSADVVSLNASLLSLFRERVDQPARSNGILVSPKEIFRGLLKRDDTSLHRTDHPQGISKFFCSAADLLSHSIPYQNSGSPSTAFNLSVLYGSSEETQSLRLNDGTGMLRPICLGSSVVDHDAATCTEALVALFNRSHNNIVNDLVSIPDRWQDISICPTRSLAQRDRELFQDARDINLSLFRDIIAKDFIKGLLGFSGTETYPDIDVLAGISPHGTVPHGPTAEASVLYQCLDMSSRIGMGLGQPKRTPDANTPIDIRQYEDHIAESLYAAIDSCATQPGAKQMPPSAEDFVVKTVEASRKRNVCSLNEYRRHLGLQPHKSFSDWNPNENVISAATELYGTIDNLELYPGLQAEATIPFGFGLGYTLTYGLLMDLIPRLRAIELNVPRFLTDRHRLQPHGGAFGTVLPSFLQRNIPHHFPSNNVYSLFPFYTPSKMKKTLNGERKKGNATEACGFTKPGKVHILTTLHTIEQVFKSHQQYPTMYGEKFKLLTGGYGYQLGFDQEYIHDQDQYLTLYSLIPDSGALHRYAVRFGELTTKLINKRAKSKQDYSGSWIDLVEHVINGVCIRWVCETLLDYQLSDLDLDEQDELAKEEAELHEKLAVIYAFVFENDAEHGRNLQQRAQCAAAEFSKHIESKIPLPAWLQPKVETSPFKLLVDDVQSQKIPWHFLKYMAGPVPSMVEGIGAFVKQFTAECSEGGTRVPHTTSGTFLERVVYTHRRFPIHQKRDGLRFDEVNPDSDRRDREQEVRRIVANVLGLAVIISVTYAKTCALAIDFFMDDARSKQRDRIIQIATEDNDPYRPSLNAEIMGYIREAQRLSQPLGLWRNVKQDAIIHRGTGEPPTSVRAGDRIFADFSAALRNPANFSKPDEVDPTRKTPSIQGIGMHRCPGLSFVDQTMPEVFKAIFRMRGICRSPDKHGRIQKANMSSSPLRSLAFVDDQNNLHPYPRNLRVEYTGFHTTKEMQDSARESIWKQMIEEERSGRKRNAMNGISLGSILASIQSFFTMVLLGIFGWSRGKTRSAQAQGPLYNHVPTSWMGGIVIKIHGSISRGFAALTTMPGGGVLEHIQTFIEEAVGRIQPGFRGIFIGPIKKIVDGLAATIKTLLSAVFIGLLGIGAAFKGGRLGSDGILGVVRTGAPAPQRRLLPPFACQQPTDYKEAYIPQAMSSSQQGIPEFSFLENFVRAQRITISDAEERDMEMELDVDNKYYRRSTSATFNSEVECGHDVWRCRDRGFSRLLAFVPPGEHNVTIRWQPIDGHSTPVPGKSYTFLWERVWCS